MANLLTRVFSPRKKQGPGGPGFHLPISGGYLPPDAPWNWFQLGWDPLPWGKSSVVAACVSAYAQTIAMCPPTHWRKLANNGRERVSNSALSRILKVPNDYQSISDFMLNMVSNLYADGNAYALALRNNRYEVSELHLFDPRVSRPEVKVTGDIFYTLGGNPVIEAAIPHEMLNAVPARDVLHLKLNVVQPYTLRGEPPLTAAMADIAASDAIVRQALAYVQNQGRPSGIIYTDKNWDAAQTAEMRARWNEMTRGANAGNTPILTAGIKWEASQVSSRDEQLAELLQISDQRIATAYRVPLALLSLAVGQAPAGSVDGLTRFWKATGLGFAIAHVEEGLGRFFGLAGLPDEYVEFDTQALERSNMLDRIEAEARGVQGGIFSPNEARAMESLPGVKDGDEPRVQQQVVPLSFAGKVPAAPPQPAPPPAEPQKPPEPDQAKRLADFRSAYGRARIAA